VEEYEGAPAAANRDDMNRYSGLQFGDVNKAAEVIVEVMTGTGVAEGKEMPLRLLLGNDANVTVIEGYEKTLRYLESERANM